MTFGEKLKFIRNERNLSQQELADILKTSKQVISRYELGQTTPKITVVANWCKILGVSLNNMLNDLNDVYDESDDIEDIPGAFIPSMRRIALLGTIACGEPILARENLDGEVVVPDDIRADFALRCKGDSMIDARIMDGDIVYIRQQPVVENGEIAAVLIDDEATLKRVYLSENTITLMACNAKYQPLVYTGSQLEEVRIIGKAVGFTSAVV